MTGPLVNVGFGNMVAVDKVVAVISPLSAPAKRLRDEARAKGLLIDVTQGRRTRSILITISNQVILTAVQVETLAGRFNVAATGDVLKKEERKEEREERIVT